MPTAMTTDIELTDLANKRRQEQEDIDKDSKADPQDQQDPGSERRDASIAAWAWTSAGV